MQAVVKQLRRMVLGVGLVALAGSAGGCGRGDTRVNADPGPGYPSQADSGSPSIADRKDGGTQAAGPAKEATPGVNSAGLPASSSGGTVGAGSGSGTSGTKSGSGLQSADRPADTAPDKSK